MDRACEDPRRTELLEALAELEHKQWQEWALHILDTEDLTPARRERWRETLFKSYHELTEGQKFADRVWAEQVLWILKKHMGIK